MHTADAAEACEVSLDPRGEHLEGLARSELLAAIANVSALGDALETAQSELIAACDEGEASATAANASKVMD